MKSGQIYREANKERGFRGIFESSQDQRKLIINFERQFLDILSSYVSRHVDDVCVRRKLCSLLNDLSIASDPFLIDEELLDEIFNLEITIKDVLYKLNQNGGRLLKKSLSPKI